MENFDFATKVFFDLISMLSSLICGFMTGFGGTAQLLISYNYENGRISRRRFGFSVRDFV